MSDFSNGYQPQGSGSVRQAPASQGWAPRGWTAQQPPAGFGPAPHGQQAQGPRGPGQQEPGQQGQSRQWQGPGTRSFGTPPQGFRPGHQGPAAPQQGFRPGPQGPGTPPQGFRPGPQGPGTPPWDVRPRPGTPPHGFAPPRTFGPPPVRPTAARPAAAPKRGGATKIVAAVLAVGVLAGGGAYAAFGDTSALFGSTATSAAEPAADGNEPALLAAGSSAVPACPFTAEKVTELLGQPMEDQGNCLFGDGKGVASLTVETHSASSTEVVYDYSRDTATRTYTAVHDIDRGKKGYLAYKDTGAEAIVIGAEGGFTLYLSSFEQFEGASYEPAMLKVVDALGV
ncbi:MAG: hypothetical protein OJJ54_21000 [Pseudonocardia sp.]|nr:hypothetical protein [Pseudonocardia sp.]